MTNSSGNRSNCLLSEFGDLTAQFLIVGLMIFAIVLMTLTLWLGEITYSNGLFVYLYPVLTGAGDGAISTIKWWKGYFADVNHGPCLLVFMLGIYFFFGLFLNKANASIEAIAPAAQQNISGSNRKEFMITVFKKRVPVLFVLITLLIAMNLRNEFSSLFDRDIIDGTVKSVGYTQRQFFHKFSSKLNKSDGLVQLELIKELPLVHEKLKTEIKDKVLRNENLAEPWEKYLSVEDRRLTYRSATTRYSNPQGEEPVDIDIERAITAKKPLLKIISSCNATPLSEKLTDLHYLFIFCVALVEGTFHGFLIWAVLKIIFWFSVVWKLLPTTATSVSNAAKVDFNDTEKAYGMKALYPAYNAVLFFVILASFLGLSQQINAVNSGLVITNQYSPQMITVYLKNLGVALVLSAFLVGPVIFFAKRMNNLKQSELKKKERELDSVANNDKLSDDEKKEKKKKINEDKVLVLKQTTWPMGDASFVIAMFLAVYIFVAPISSKSKWVKEILDDLPNSDFVSKIVDVHSLLRNELDIQCERMYGKQPVYPVR